MTPGIRRGTSKSLCGSRRGRIERVASRVFTAVIRASQVVPLCLAGSYQQTWLTVFSPCGKSFSHEGNPVSQCEMGFQTLREIFSSRPVVPVSRGVRSVTQSVVPASRLPHFGRSFVRDVDKCGYIYNVRCIFRPAHAIPGCCVLKLIYF